MLEQMAVNADNINKVFSTFKVSMFLGIIINIIIISVLFRLTDMFINKLKARFINPDNSATLAHVFPILEKVIKTLIFFFITASFLQSQGYSLTSLIAGFGITGLAVGFAAQQTIASMFGTLAILTDKVFKIGDYIRVNNIEGTVENITLHSTKVRTLDNFMVTIPNNIIDSNVVENISRAKKRKIQVVFGITYNTSEEKIQKAIAIIKSVMKSRHDVTQDFRVNLDALDSSSINIKLFGYVKTSSIITLEKVRGEILFEIVKQFRTEGIEFAYPSQTIYMAK
mgnify:FL=1